MSDPRMNHPMPNTTAAPIPTARTTTSKAQPVVVPHRERFVVTLEAAPARYREAPAGVRLRKALKILLRAFGLKCVRIEPCLEGPGGTLKE